MNYSLIEKTKNFVLDTFRSGQPINRRDFWEPAAVILVAYVVLAFLANVLGSLGWIASIAMFALAVVLISGCVRRFRDAGFSPWLVLLWLIPGVGALVVLIMAALPTKSN